MPVIDTGDTAFMLVSAALVLFMTPGLALFHAGTGRSKNVLSITMQSFFAMGIVGYGRPDGPGSPSRPRARLPRPCA